MSSMYWGMQTQTCSKRPQAQAQASDVFDSYLSLFGRAFMIPLRAASRIRVGIKSRDAVSSGGAPRRSDEKVAEREDAGGEGDWGG